MRFYHSLLFCLCISLAIVGCTVAFDAEQEGTFPCASDNDCVDGFECSTTSNLCMKIQTGVPDSPDCEDKDGDGYGVNDDRTNCRYAKFDCDDNDPNVHPDNTETCDGIDNSCDGNIDVFECPGGAAIECGSPPVGGNDIKFACVDFQCVLVHKVQITQQCREIVASCNSAEKAFTYEVGGQTYHLVDEAGDLQGPIVEQCG